MQQALACLTIALVHCCTFQSEDSEEPNPLLLSFHTFISFDRAHSSFSPSSHALYLRFLASPNRSAVDHSYFEAARLINSFRASRRVKRRLGHGFLLHHFGKRPHPVSPLIECGDSDEVEENAVYPRA